MKKEEKQRPQKPVYIEPFRGNKWMMEQKR